jgi:hypothetical protein
MIAASGGGQTGPVGQPLPEPLVVRVLDQYGGAAEGARVEWRADVGGGSVSPTSSEVDQGGFAQTTFTLGSVTGTNGQRASATVRGLGVVYFYATATSTAVTRRGAP